MKILAMTATFGRLDHARLELGTGLNILEAPNEGGKSTWCAFLRAMLYGIPTRERDSKGAIAEKNRYQPWSGAPMEGVLELEHEGRLITLRRGPKGSVPFGDFSAVYTDTSLPVPGLTAETCGETLLGVSREVFERSAFVGQGGAAIGESSALEKRIAALVSSGEEGVSFSEAEATLKEWQHRRRYNRNGILPRLEAERGEVTASLSALSLSRERADAAAQELAGLTARRAELERQRKLCRQREHARLEALWQDSRNECDRAEADAAALLDRLQGVPSKEALLAAQGDLAYHQALEAERRSAEHQLPALQESAAHAQQCADSSRFAPRDADELCAAAAADAAEASSLTARADTLRRCLPLALVLSLLLGAGIFAALFFLVQLSLTAALCAGAGVFALAGFVCVLVLSRRRKTTLETISLLLRRYGVEEIPAIEPTAAEYRALCRTADESRRTLSAAERAHADLLLRQEDLQERLLALVRPFAGEVTGLYGVSAALSRALELFERHTAARVKLDGARRLLEAHPRPEPLTELPVPDTGEELSPTAVAAALAALDAEERRLTAEVSLARGELNTLGDPLALESRLDALDAELRERRIEHEALTLALGGLSAANEQLQALFSPRLNGEAGEIFSALTDRRYEEVALTRDFEASARESGALLPHRSLSLSQGTADQLYLAVRLAICRLALPEDAPLVLDDALVNFDDARAALALDFLRRECQARQILLFTCHTREAAACREDPACTVRAL